MAQESSRDPHNDVDYVAGFGSGDEEHPSYGACKATQWEPWTSRTSRWHSVFGYARESPATSWGAVGIGTEAAEARDLSQKKERREVILDNSILQRINAARISISTRAGLTDLTESQEVTIQSDSLETYHPDRITSFLSRVNNSDERHAVPYAAPALRP